MRRHLLGIIALLFMLVGLGSYFHLTGSIVGQSGAANMCLRVGLVLGAIWLAMPRLETISPWILVIALVSSVLVMLNPFLLVYLVVILLAVGAIRYVARTFLPNFSIDRKTRRAPRNTRSQRSEK